MTKSLHGYIGTLANLDESLRLAGFRYIKKENSEDLRYRRDEENAKLQLLHEGLPHLTIANPRKELSEGLQQIGFHATPDTWVINITED